MEYAAQQANYTSVQPEAATYKRPTTDLYNIDPYYSDPRRYIIYS